LGKLYDAFELLGGCWGELGVVTGGADEAGGDDSAGGEDTGAWGEDAGRELRGTGGDDAGGDDTGAGGEDAGPVLRGTGGIGTLDEAGTDGNGGLEETGTDGTAGGDEDGPRLGTETGALGVSQGEQSKPMLWMPTSQDSWGELGATWHCTDVAPPHWVFWTEFCWPALQETVW
jgi:hypothetical protein